MRSVEDSIFERHPMPPVWWRSPSPVREELVDPFRWFKDIDFMLGEHDFEGDCDASD